MARGGEWGPTDVFVSLFSMFSITLPLIVFKKFVFSGKERFGRKGRRGAGLGTNWYCHWYKCTVTVAL